MDFENVRRGRAGVQTGLKGRVLWDVCFWLSAVPGGAACFWGSPVLGGGEPIRVGDINPLTGNLALHTLPLCSSTIDVDRLNFSVGMGIGGTVAITT